MPTLDWIGKKAVLNHHRQVPYRLLKSENSLSVGDADSGNLLVQGDNLLALKALLPYYAGKVKCIYIDPPYNTGNENWIYNDAVNSPEIRQWLGKVVGAEAEDLSRHDKWLCMMYPRLSLLRDFLAEDGAIFISIDDTEVGHLRILLDEIFGPRNFIVNLIWQKMDSPSSNSRNRPFSNYHDHTLVYARTADSCRISQLSKPEILDAYPEQAADGRRYRLRQLRKNGKAARRVDRPSMWYALEAPDGTEIWPIHPQEKWEGRWAISRKTYQKMKEKGEIEWKMREHGWVPYGVEWAPVEPTVPHPTILTDVGQNRQAKALLNEILGTDHGFETPKPVGLLRRILEMATDRDSLVLDSFAGSGTTGHAVLDLNKADDGNRRFILVEMDEKIARNVTAERLTRVIKGYGDIPALDGSFRYCTLGEPLFDEAGNIRESVKFQDLAAHVFFAETGSPIPKRTNGETPLLGVHNNKAVYLLFNGVQGDRRVNGGNVLTIEVLRVLPPHNGQKVIYGEGCRLGSSKLKREEIVFKQVPYDIKVS